MIGFAWLDDLDTTRAAEVDEMLAAAVEYDAEAGFSTARPASPAAGGVKHLLVTIAPAGERGDGALDALPDVPVVAYLRLDVRDGVGEAQFVVRPEFRSHGIGTLLAELLTEPGGWGEVDGLRTVRTWAHGGHPAADRMARRFGTSVAHGVFKTLRFIGGSRPYGSTRADIRLEEAAGGPPALVPGHDDAMAPFERALRRSATERLVVEGVGSAVRVGVGGVATDGSIAVQDPGAPRADLRHLLDQALVELEGRGVRVVQLFVDALADDFVGVTRELGFEHDQSDFLYELSV